MFGIYGGLILFYVDILGFAGLSFILFGLFKKYNLTDKQIRFACPQKCEMCNSICSQKLGIEIVEVEK